MKKNKKSDKKVAEPVKEAPKPKVEEKK